MKLYVMSTSFACPVGCDEAAGEQVYTSVEETDAPGRRERGRPTGDQTGHLKSEVNTENTSLKWDYWLS